MPSTHAGYTRLDYQIALLLADRGETVKLTGAHNIDTRQALAAEIAKSVNKDEATLITLGYAPPPPAAPPLTDRPKSILSWDRVADLTSRVAHFLDKVKTPRSCLMPGQSKIHASLWVHQVFILFLDIQSQLEAPESEGMHGL